MLREGHIVERGNHASLLAHDAWYARQWRYQQLEASLEADGPLHGSDAAAPIAAPVASADAPHAG